MRQPNKSVVVLMGGWSNERDVSLSTAEGVIKTLTAQGYAVTAIDVSRDLEKLLFDLKHAQPDVVFNALHGTGGEDGVIQGILDMLRIPYTHSGVTASAIAMDKILSRLVFMQVDIPVPDYRIIPLETYKNDVHPFSFPYVIKPLNEGSSRGVYIIKNNAERDAAMNEWTFGDHVLAEAYVPGREIQVAVIDGKAIGAIELKPHSGFYDYEAKYTDGKTEHIMPAPLSDADQALLFSYAEKAHTVLGCKGVTRADFRLDETVEHHTINCGARRMALLEINTQPGLTPLSLVPEIAAYYGISFGELLNQIIERATCAQ